MLIRPSEELQRDLETVMELQKDKIDEILSKYLYKTTEDITHCAPKIKADIAELFGVPVEWVEIYIEDMTICQLKVLIRPKEDTVNE